MSTRLPLSGAVLDGRPIPLPEAAARYQISTLRLDAGAPLIVFVGLALHRKGAL